MKILIVGRGEIGSAIGRVLSSSQVCYWDRNETKCTPGIIPERAAAEADFIFFCIPSTGLRDAALFLERKIGPKAVIISLTKGMEAGTNKTADEILSAIFSKNPVVVLGGPMLADELMQGKRGVGVFASSSEVALRECAGLFNNSAISVETTKDVRGLALCGILKNIYALSFGFAEGVGSLNNVWGYLTAEGSREMGEIVQSLGGQRETVFGPGGIGDLVASGSSENGLNRRAGREIMMSGKPGNVSEGLVSMGPLSSLLGENAKKYRLLKTISSIIQNPGSRKEIFEKYIKEA